MQKGNIGVTSKDIFPLIKKFMYNDQDIFIREIVSNAIDATQKLITLINSNEYSANKEDLKVTVTLNANEKTITVSDNGIGMTLEEISISTRLLFLVQTNSQRNIVMLISLVILDLVSIRALW